ncbi:MAG: Tm-1-like ATP-binding domain-containing protein [Eubacteriales bacterium]|nr:Tm-1-like ATP-binding domain-containing protein [Eubacteriales bacterium]
MKTIAVIGSCDTKYREVAYMRERIETEGLRVLVLDTATGPGMSYGYDVSREEILKSAGVSMEEMASKTKGEKIRLMTDAVTKYVEMLYKARKIDGILAAGGLQNTVMATNAMRSLPIGFPKVMATTVACGGRTFGPFVGEKDIVMIPSICDFTGMNLVIRRILDNACACCAGMVRTAGRVLEKGDRPVVGMTLMGVTNTGACAAAEELERMGLEVVGFHATGTGGVVMEQMAEDGLLDGILDLTIHELTSEFFGGGFSYSREAKNRLVKSVRNRIPLVISLGGLDFVDFAPDAFLPRMEERVFMYHNAEMAHIKILPDEAEKLADRVLERLEKIDYPVKLLIPTDGMRHNTRKGEELYCRKVDEILTRKIGSVRNPNIACITIPGNLDTKEWGIQAAHFMAEELKERGVL